MSTITTDLPDLSGEYRVTTEQIAYYRQHGHVLIRGVCSPEEIAAYRSVLVGAAMRYSNERRKLTERDTYGKAFLQIGNLWEKEDDVRRFVFARRFAAMAAGLMGVKGVRLYHDQALFKEAHGGPTPWHQDQYYWPLETDKTITMWMPLVDATTEMGTMNFASGSHALGFLGHLQISDESEAVYEQLIRERGMAINSCGSMAAGDASFHSGWTLHSAPGNVTDTTREVMTIIYFGDGARILVPDNPSRQNDLDHCLPGQKPGELAASRLNPVLYP